MLGVGGMLARINRKRGTGKGRAASVSLALAIVLLMTAGSLSVFLGTLTDVVTGGGELAGEVGVVGPTGCGDVRRAKGRPTGTCKPATMARRRAESALRPKPAAAR